MDTVHTAITEPMRRLEVFTGAGRRRKWSDADKARTVAEIVASGDSVCSVARRHGLSPQQLFGWRALWAKQIGVALYPQLGAFETSAQGCLASVIRNVFRSARAQIPVCTLADLTRRR